ncbi:DUF3862 domain-containing protein [Bacillus toyonensis]|uniref:DUF3862 domain-containing protein n=1 Tax=Bacillus toyonensis TaxID=155322 RepID=UPI000BF159F7|nr:DUF3862 domain-containing protein [Bacillus toyonensis]PEL24304.1 hypothetical protein CN624_18065 [Bacillus toyonensis]
MKESKQKKAFYKKWWFWVLAAIVAASAVGNSNDDKEVVKEAPKTEETAAPPKQEVKKEEPKKEVKKEEPKKDGISKAEFEQVQNGMTYDEVKAIIGSEGELQSESEVAGYKTVMYMFKGESGIGANATMMFQNNELTSKSQFGLK